MPGLLGKWHTVEAAVRHIGNDGGPVVLISCTNGIRRTANTAHYTASKHAVVGLARTLANEFGPQNVRVMYLPWDRRWTAGALLKYVMGQ